MTSDEKKLIKFFKGLSETDQHGLLVYAEFLLTRENQVPIVETLQKPEDIPRPMSESVVVAIKRLSATYPMINKSGVLDKAAQLMTEHMINGKDAKLVINELEVLFSNKYKEYCDSFSI